MVPETGVFQNHAKHYRRVQVVRAAAELTGKPVND
jgi:hypothetical protein